MIADSHHMRSSWFGACAASGAYRETGIAYAGDGWYIKGNTFVLMVAADNTLLRYWVWVDCDPRELLQQVASLPVFDPAKDMSNGKVTADAGTDKKDRKNVRRRKA